MEIGLSDLHPSLRDPVLSSMTFLNEIANRYPSAVSFGPGRPYEGFFEVAAVHRYLRRFCGYLSTELGYDDATVRRALMQYGRTKGIVHELIARHLAVDEGVDVDPEAVVVTVGCQEAMFLVLRALRAGPRDILLAVAPTYSGLTGVARLVELPVWPVRGGPAGIDLDDLREQARRARVAGLQPRGCYVIPDFANPSGVSLSRQTRQALLDVAAAEELLLLEDNPYGLFHDGTRLPTLKALDRQAQVVYLGSLSKTCLPGARVGFLVADQPVTGTARDRLFADQLARIKSMVTVNTAPLAQAVIGGRLLEHDCSLLAATVRERAVYQRNLRHLLEGLRQRFPDGDVAWNSPRGGFFAVLSVPFDADDAAVEYSAKECGVLWTPMSHFYDGAGGLRQMRLSVSLLTAGQIDTGLDRLAKLVAGMGQP